MISKTSKTKRNISLTLSNDFIQYCELNEIEDIEKVAKETFKRGFDLLKYGRLSEKALIPQDKERTVKEEVKLIPKPSKDILHESPDVPVVEPPTIVEAVPLKSSDGSEEFRKMGVVVKKKDEEKDLYYE